MRYKSDKMMVKVVTLAESSRQQQVNDNCFSKLNDVPMSAITLSIPALLKAGAIYCVVPGINKAEAVYHTLNSDVQAVYLSTILRKHNDASLYLDHNSSSNI